eukprot:CAMPEP_0119042452 /NCGR_PEP_ID=MMETSP1177-20130426/15263_1 /TAXON_ID=2985 /ORGANISM="Ochromonas sp, Strain CCMP1899" /LENGTH=91 /DNA_ID=CAMNT_0007009261 /DNA_START=177 /DNA_END=452 /DNA_ORIENTATION=+
MTEVQTETLPVEPKTRKVLILKLKKKPGISWSEGTVDNENMGKKSSKRCCIFHRKKAFAESDSDESDSDTEVAKKTTPKSNLPKAYQRHHA